jgi:predicted alpha-1,2-mannosidase
MLALAGVPPAVAAAKQLWQIGRADQSPAEFALAPDGHRQFYARFGRPDQPYYIGLSTPGQDWPCTLPGPLDDWAGGGRRATVGTWDMLHTLPIGFVLAQPPRSGNCLLTIRLSDTHPERPPRLRATVNGHIFERDTLPGGGMESLLKGDLTSAKPQTLRFEFPAALLRPGYNEIALRNTRGNWLVFDHLELSTPEDAQLAPPACTVVRSVTAPGYAVSPAGATPATVRLEVFRAATPGTLTIQIGDATPLERPLAPGLQILEIPAAASPQGRLARVRLSADDRLLHETELALQPSPPATPADYVDVFRGTAHSRWMIAPGPWMPFGMVKLSPDNQPQVWAAGYEYSHEFVDCFSHLHEWTMAGLGVMPTSGPLRTKSGLDGAGYSSRFDKSTERAGIGFYEVLLRDTGIMVELAATTRAALMRFTYPASSEARVLFPLLLPNEYKMEILGATLRRSGPAELEGVIRTNFPGGFYEQRFDLHFVAQFSRPFERLGGWEPGRQVADATEVAVAGDCGAWVQFKTGAGEQVLLRTGLSLVSTANARLNLEHELAGPFGWDFAAVVRNQRAVWNELLGRIAIETPDAREKTRFYTNFYRAMSGRNIWSDVNGEWTDPEERRQKLDRPGAVMLGGDAFWNTFWNLNPLMNLAAPEWSARWVQSQLALYDHCGWLSKGPAGLEYIAVMVAEHEIPLLVAAHQHGIKGLDAKKILDAAVKMQTTLPQKHPGGGWVGNEHLESYLRHGFVAVDGPTPPEPAKWRRAFPSNTLEYAYDDWCVAQLARALGRHDLAATFEQRAQNWRHLFDPATGYTRPRRADGTWVEPFHPLESPGYVEGNAWQFTWFVPHDVPGLVQAMGAERFVDRLRDGFERSALTRFTAPSAQHHLTLINHGNQPNMHAAWLFNWAGQPWLTQRWVRAILDTYYGYNPSDAYLGDEDQGQMSGWFVLAALGLFQMDGGCRVDPVYELAAPLYPQAIVKLSGEHYSGRTFTIEARQASPANRYIQAARLNDRPLERWWIRQRDLIAGGRLVLELGPEPNPAWPADRSPPP